MQRFTLLLVPGLIVIAVYIGISNFESLRDQPAVESGSAALDYNAVSQGINTVLYDISGSINYTLSAISQIHYNDDSIELEKPVIKLYQDGDSRWNIVADSGRISSTHGTGDATAQTIDLSGAVQVSSLDEYGNIMLMSTDYLSLDPQLETLQTDRPVTIVTNTVQQSSIGMYANLKTDEIILHDDIRGSYARPGN